jgi:hypothetical protein
MSTKATPMSADQAGSSPVEFLLVGLVLTALTLAVVQLGLAVYIRNLVHDAAVEGAYHAALADVPTSEGAERARMIIERTVGEGFVGAASARDVEYAGVPSVEVTVVATLPLVGVVGIPDGWEVTAHAPAHIFEP